MRTLLDMTALFQKPRSYPFGMSPPLLGENAACQRLISKGEEISFPVSLYSNFMSAFGRYHVCVGGRGGCYK